MLLDYDEFESPIGKVVFASIAEGICGLGFEGYEKRWGPIFERRWGSFELRQGSDPHRLKPILKRYFAGDVDSLDSVPVTLGGAPFQQKVWKELRKIRAGETRTYGELARILGNPQASRAVGHANAVNPVSLIVPCHRVVGSTSLTGYGGGLERKQWLLRHEGAQLSLAAGA
ncbi:MAG TPA: methylated-DNA--[protein]-cysteine S-methyltransferase [Bryobacteraceae bacterium]|nr:methylated-DNA--[protein]-cysteine S-methyltransferase [Bryobacteraceae bacterium]